MAVQQMQLGLDLVLQNDLENCYEHAINLACGD